MYTLKLLLIILLVLISGCNKGKNNTTRLDLGQIEDNRLNEISGMDNSQINKDVFWLHNDSGDSAQIFAIDNKGKHLGKFSLKNIENRDWEDITVGPGSSDGQSYIYIGEIGDNESIYAVKYIYKIKEPQINFDKVPYDSIIHDVEMIAYKYPDGPRDAETLMIDPLTMNLIIVSKREESVHVYMLLFPQNTDSINIPQQISTLPITQVTGGDISNSGKKIIMKNYDNIYYWLRKPGQSLRDAFSQFPEHLTYIVEPQGEAICWSNDEKGYFTLSEEPDNIEARLYFYAFK